MLQLLKDLHPPLPPHLCPHKCLGQPTSACPGQPKIEKERLKWRSQNLDMTMELLFFFLSIHCPYYFSDNEMFNPFCMQFSTPSLQSLLQIKRGRRLFSRPEPCAPVKTLDLTVCVLLWPTEVTTKPAQELELAWAGLGRKFPFLRTANMQRS